MRKRSAKEIINELMGSPNNEILYHESYNNKSIVVFVYKRNIMITNGHRMVEWNIDILRRWFVNHMYYFSEKDFDKANVICNLIISRKEMLHAG